MPTIDRRTLFAAAATTLAGPALGRPAANRFPQGFLWGAATAAYQVEGNNVNSDIWLMEHVKPTAYSEVSGDATNSFVMWPTDLDLVRNMGLNAYRFSLEWARIEPEPGQFSIAMLDHYKAMIDGCHARGLQPVVTFNHFSTPRWFGARGAWNDAQSPAAFARYCERAARHLAGGITFATTLNEPNLSGVLGEVLPPGIGDRLMETDRLMGEAAARASGSSTFSAGNSLYVADPARFQANLLAAHRAGRAAIKGVRPDLPVGVSLAIIDDQEAGPGSLRDAKRARFYGAWLDAARADDFVGVQNYERTLWDAKGRLPAPKGAPVNDMGAEIYPASLAGAVRYAHAMAGVPVIVTEHGINAADDTLRARLIPAALTELARAIADGVPVKGYMHWSLLDNFEWVFGYGPKYGLHSVDRTTFRRTAKPSAAVFGAIARRNAV